MRPCHDLHQASFRCHLNYVWQFNIVSIVCTLSDGVASTRCIVRHPVGASGRQTEFNSMFTCELVSNLVEFRFYIQICRLEDSSLPQLRSTDTVSLNDLASFREIHARMTCFRVQLPLRFFSRHPSLFRSFLPPKIDPQFVFAVRHVRFLLPWISGSRLMKEGAEAKMRERIFPRATLITPNLMEAEVLLGRSLRRPQDVENGAADLLRSSGAGGVLIKGGHSTDTREDQDEASPNDHSGSAGFSQDYWTNGNPSESFWLTTPRIDSKNTHGTGCTLSSAAAACLARGLDPTDAVVISKAYVTEGIRAAHQLGQGPGPVAQAGWPTRADCFPWVTATSGGGAKERSEAFPRCHDDWGLYPIVDTSEW